MLIHNNSTVYYESAFGFHFFSQPIFFYSSAIYIEPADILFHYMNADKCCNLFKRFQELGNPIAKLLIPYLPNRKHFLAAQMEQLFSGNRQVELKPKNVFLQAYDVMSYNLIEFSRALM